MEVPTVTITLLLKNNHDYVMASKVWRDKFEKIKHIEENFFNKIVVRSITSKLDGLKFEHINQSLTDIETPTPKLKNVKRIRKQEKPKKVWVSKLPVCQLPLDTPSCGSSLQRNN